MAEYLDLDADLIVKRGRKRSIAFAPLIICALAVDRLLFSGADIARQLDITPSAASKLAIRGRTSPLLSEIEVETL